MPIPFTNIEFTTILPYLVGAVGGIGAMIASGLVKEGFDERGRKKKHKLEVARHVLSICTEASTSNFRLPPRDIEHIHSVLSNLERINKDIETMMNKFVSLWQLIIERHNTQGLGRRGAQDLVNMRNEIEEKRKSLVEWANKVRY